MDAMLFVARTSIGLVFLVSGLSKLTDQPGTAAAAQALGVPTQLSGSVARLLPWAELLVGAAILVPFTAIWGAAAAAALLGAFSVVIALSLARGKHVDCHCFGQLHSHPIGWRTLVRNLALFGAAVFALVTSGQTGTISSWAWLTSAAETSVMALVTAVISLFMTVATAAVVVQTIRQNGRVLLRLEVLEKRIPDSGGPLSPGVIASHPGLAIGAAAPRFLLPGLHGETLTLESQLATGLPTMLTFLDPGCGPCTALIPDLAKWQRELRRELSLLIVSRGTAEQNMEKLSGLALSGVLLQSDREVANKYSAYGTPSAVLIAPDGRIASTVAAGADAIRQLIRQTSSRQHTGRPELRDPQPAPSASKLSATLPSRAAQYDQTIPDIELTRLDGSLATLAEGIRNKTVILFWNPACGFCQNMTDDLRAWEHDRPAHAPDLVIVICGALHSNTAIGFSSPVYLDGQFRIGSALGVNGTPAAVLVDVTGQLRSTVMVGASAVLDLLWAGRSGE